MLGAAFDPDSNRLFVLDVDDGTVARLVEHDLARGISKRLWTTSYTSAFESVYLGLGSDRRLVLAVSGAGTWTAWAIDADSGKARFTGRIDSAGTPANTPAMGAYELSMPVIQGSTLAYEELAAHRFKEGAACSGL